jgi:very-short-patch-repair endonuclease
VEIGIGRTVIARWTADNRLHRVHPRVYAVGHRALSIEGRLAAALFYAGPDPALCGMTAATWLGILPGVPRLIHVVAPRRRRSVPDVRTHHRRRFERILHKRLPVIPPAQALLEIAPHLHMRELRRALAEAEYRKLVTLDDVEAVLGRGKPGAAALRAVLECHRPELARTRSALEDQLVYLCEHHALLVPDLNVWVAGHQVDGVWWEQKVVVELDSQLAHGTPSRLEQDHRRDLDLRTAGYIVLRYTWQQVTGQADRVVADLRRHGIPLPAATSPAPRPQDPPRGRSTPARGSACRPSAS